MKQLLKSCMSQLPKFMRWVLLLGLALALILLVLKQIEGQRPRNVIILFADGAAMTQFEYGGYTSRQIRGQDFALFDQLLANGSLGLMTTHSNDAFVTDSAAAASAMSTGYKVNNGAVAMTPEGKPLTTLMQVARQSGKRIGLVTTAPVYDATPAAFAVSATSRKDYTQIVDAYFALQPDVLMGGGRDMFLPGGSLGSARKDRHDMLKAFAESGYGILQSQDKLAQVDSGKWLGLFALEDMAFEIDRDFGKVPGEAPVKALVQEPSLASMTKAALVTLNGQQGFVLLVENESTDTTAHQNDAAALMHDLWAFDAALRVVLDFQAQNPDTLVIVTGDHETGGLSPTYVRRKNADGKHENINIDTARLAQLGKIKGSLDQFVKQTEGLSDDEVGHAAFDVVAATFFPGIAFTPAERSAVINKTPLQEQTSYLPHNTLAQIIGKSTGVYWGTSGHTPEPVIAAAIGPGHKIFQGYYDNTDFAKKLHGLLNLIE